MADGATFDINIQAQSLGVDASASALTELADRIFRTNAVARQFDSAMSAARARLEDASAAASLAASALGTAETRYRELETAANKAAQAVEKATLAGKDTTALQAAAASSAAAMRDQAAVVDELRAKSLAAASAQQQMAKSSALLTEQSKKQVGANNALIASDKQIRTSNYAKAAADNEKLMAKSAATTEKWADRLKMVRVASLAGAVGLLAFAVAANPKAMERLNVAADKAKKNFVALFTGLKLDKFVGALEDIMGMFQKGTSSANALKAIFELLLQPVIDAITFLAPYFKEFLKGMISGILSVIITILSMRNALLAMIPAETRKAVKDFAADHLTLNAAFQAGWIIAVALTVALIAFAIAAIAAAWPILLIVAAIALVVAAFVYWEEIIDAIGTAWTDLNKTLKTAVENIITGIVNGIKNGAAAVYDAMAGLATGAISAFKAKLGIKSPSAVFAMQANYTTAGYVEGIEEGKPAVDSALESLVEPPDAPIPAARKGAASAGGTASSSGAVVNIANLTIGNGPVAQENWEAFKRAVGEVLEGAVITIGGAEAPAT